MSEFIEVHWTAGSIEEARRICRFLVQERVVACAQIIPWIESIYMWDNQLETAQETKIALKTHLTRFEEIKEIIEKNSSYEVPEITYTLLSGGNEGYLEWLDETTSRKTRAPSG